MKQLAKEWRTKHQAPADMEARLVAQFRQVHPPASRHRWPWWVAAAAAIIVVFSSLRPKQEQSPTDAHSPVAPPAYRAATVRERPAQVTAPLAAKRPLPRPATPKPQQPVEVYTDFFPLEQGSEPIEIERGRVVRVSMPRSSLIRVGLPMNMDRMNDAIQADLVLNEEGIARAVRFVQ